MTRRGFLNAAGATTAFLAAGLPTKMVLAQEGQSFEDLVPSDKRLAPAWVRSLRQRGEAETYSGWEAQLKYIGMPVGGIGCGQLYLGGDGRLWHWDIFKCNYRREPDHGQRIDSMTLGGHYANPIAFGEEYSKWNGASVQQGFVVRVKQAGRTTLKTLDHIGFPEVAFRGEYPIGKVTYKDKALPVEIGLEAFSPFVPLNAKDSALPATVMRYTVTNTSDEPVEVDLAGYLENKTATYTSDASLGQRRNRVAKGKGRVSLLSTVESPPPSRDSEAKLRDDILLADFESDDWGDWKAEGAAFRGGPFGTNDLSPVQDSSGIVGSQFVNSYNSRVEGVNPDNLRGTLTGPEFKVERKYLSLLIAGGNRSADAFVEVVIDDKPVASVTGRNDNRLRPTQIDLSSYQGETARVRVVDNATGGWAQVAADQIVLTDKPIQVGGVEERHGYGSMALSLLHDGDEVIASIATDLDGDTEKVFEKLGQLDHAPATRPLNEPLIGALGASIKLAPGKSKTVTYAITWYFPDYLEIDEAPGEMSSMIDFRKLRRHYAPWFNSAGQVAQRLVDDRVQLIDTTRLWNQTWYDSTLPHWLLDRSFISIDCMASQTWHWFDSGRSWGWEGVDCCPGTCQHVWHYAQALGRIFPEIERDMRTRVDFGLAQNGDGGTGHRGPDTAGGYGRSVAHDGHLGRILGAYREHLTSTEDAYLTNIYPRVKRAMQLIIRQDRDRDGLLEGDQHNTLDATWSGPMGWISSLYLAALAACEAMANRQDDRAFARECRTLIDRGSKRIVEEVFDGEYFIHKPDNPSQISSNKGCHIDQVLGEAWAKQVGLGRVVPEEQTLSALNSLWRYNFAPDAWDYAVKHRDIEQAFRPYATEGESGLLMCTWPKGGAIEAIPGQRLRSIQNPEVWTGPGGYFNETMNGFEYQVAAHMIYEGEADSDLVEKGLAITRAVHDRYTATKRNPYNEIECSDHYARSMASYGVFLAACGYTYDGPAGHIGFAPRITPDNFRAPFTAANGWGTFSQNRSMRGAGMHHKATLELAHGELKINQVTLETGVEARFDETAAQVDGEAVEVTTKHDGVSVVLTFSAPLAIKSGQALIIRMHGQSADN